MFFKVFASLALHLEGILGRLGGVLGRLGRVFGASCGYLGPPLGVLGRLGRVLGRLGVAFATSWPILRVILRPS